MACQPSRAVSGSGPLEVYSLLAAKRTRSIPHTFPMACLRFGWPMASSVVLWMRSMSSPCMLMQGIIKDFLAKSTSLPSSDCTQSTVVHRWLPAIKSVTKDHQKAAVTSTQYGKFIQWVGCIDMLAPKVCSVSHTWRHCWWSISSLALKMETLITTSETRQVWEIINSRPAKCTLILWKIWYSYSIHVHVLANFIWHMTSWSSLLGTQWYQRDISKCTRLLYS